MDKEIYIKSDKKSQLFDAFGRKLEYLRLSITDRCNLRCSYCAPQADYSHFQQAEILTFEEIVLISRAFASTGIKKIRLTGGEPLVRRDILSLVRSLKDIPGIQHLCLTTNGVLLKNYAHDLLLAGVNHINVSLDTLDPETFKKITGRDYFSKVWQGIETLIYEGVEKIKINCVVMKGINDTHISSMAGLASDLPIDVRFIEFMPVGSESSWNASTFMSSGDAKKIIERDLGRLVPCTREQGSGPASLFRIAGWKGRVGFISPLSNHFCASCNRIRMTPDGMLRLCLFSDQEIDIKKRVRSGMSLNELVDFLKEAVLNKPANYTEAGKINPRCNRRMSRIGG